MKNNLSKLKHDSYSGILQDIHKEIVQKMKTQSLAKQASRIQNILKQIKKTAIALSQDSSSAILNHVNSQIYELIDETYNQQIAMHTTLEKGSKYTLFRRRHDQVKSIENTDDIFEEELGFLIKAAAKMKSQDIDVGTLWIGQSKASTLAIEKISDNVKEKVINLTNQAIENQVKEINRKAKLKQSKVVARQGKADINVPSLIVEGDANSIINQLLSLFSGKTFSLKNYKSYSVQQGKILDPQDISIRLGKAQSNIYKSITGSLSQVYSDYRAQKSVFYRGMQILSGNTDQNDTASPEQVKEHFAHLRFIYELRGSGLFNTDSGANQVADFIIWNDPSSENIIVRSTADLVYRYINDYSKLFSSISISAAKLYATPKKQ